MTPRRRHDNATERDALLVELLWYARLRWIAGAAILLGSFVARGTREPAWAESWTVLAGAGVVVLAYSVVLSLAIRRTPRRMDGGVRGATVIGIALDLACLSAIVGVTGGIHSPVIGMFVLHMVFVSLLMRLHASYVAALAAMAMVAAALLISGQWPATPTDWLFGVGWAGSLVLVAYVTDHITRNLRSQDEKLRAHQRAATQHEKMTALGRMTAGVVHEIANPLSNMDSMLQLAARRPGSLTPETGEALREQLGRINRILQQMRSFAHPDQTGRESVVLDDVVEGALSFVRFDKRLSRVDLRKTLGCDGMRVELNPHALQQVLVNLVTNALDALDDREPARLDVETRRDADRCVIRVADNGCGIAPGVIERIFDPFFTTKPVGYGTGLGLSISYRLVEGMGGEIRVRSVEGEGTSFEIELPLKPEVSPTRDTPGHSDSRN